MGNFLKGFDYSYYSDVFGGKGTEQDFNRYSETACDVVSLLIGRDVESFSNASVIRALCAQLDHLIIHSDRDRGIVRESIGEYSVSYSEGAVDVSSLSVSPEAVTVLTRAGLLTRWA